MSYVEGISREQVLLFPEAVDDYLTEENPVRFINAFVEGLNLKGLGFKNTILQPTGRPPLRRYQIFGKTMQKHSRKSFVNLQYSAMSLIFLLERW